MKRALRTWLLALFIVALCLHSVASHASEDEDPVERYGVLLWVSWEKPPRSVIAIDLDGRVARSLTVGFVRVFFFRVCSYTETLQGVQTETTPRIGQQAVDLEVCSCI